MKNLSDYPAYTAAVAKLAELQNQRADIVDDARAASTGNLSPIDVAARRLLGDGEFTAADPLQRDEVAERLLILDRAIEMQRQTVAEERSAASAEICAAALPTHRRNVAKVATALATLTRAVLEEEQLRDELFAADVAFAATIRPMPFVANNCRGAKDVAELAECYAAEAKQYGLA